MNIREQIEMERKGEDTVPNTYHITKAAEESLEFYARQLEINQDAVLDILLRYLALTDNCTRVLADLGAELDPTKLP